MTQISFDSDQRYCVFQNGGDWYGLPALSVRSVVPLPKITRTPLSDPVLEGLCHIQNEFMGVVSLQALAQSQYGNAERSADQQLMILLGPQGPWGLQIDQVIDLIALETSLSAFNDQQDQWSQVTMGTASHQNQIIQILDPGALYQYAANLLDMYWQGGQLSESHLS